MVPAGLNIQQVSAKEFQDRFAAMSNSAYDAHGALGSLMGFTPPQEATDEDSLRAAILSRQLEMKPALEEVRE